MSDSIIKAQGVTGEVVRGFQAMALGQKELELKRKAYEDFLRRFAPPTEEE